MSETSASAKFRNRIRDNLSIFVTGLTSLPMGSMEYRNLGNYMIMEPFFRLLREGFPNSSIATSLQLSDNFCNRFKIRSLHCKRFWTYGQGALLAAIFDTARAGIWRLFQDLLGLRCSFLLENSALLEQIDKADLVIDFSGDRYGDNVPLDHFLESSFTLVTSRVLGKPTVMLAGSPGPYTGILRQKIASFVLSRLDLITNRESISTEILANIGVRGTHVQTTACPAFLFETENGESKLAVLEGEGIGGNRDRTPLAGLIICDLNMQEEPIERLPRDDKELYPFVKLIRFLIEEKNFRVCIMSHENALGSDGKLIPGHDHRIISQLFGLLNGQYSSHQLFTLKRCYDARATREIIGQFDLLISGRAHGAIQGITQYIPTAIIDYGSVGRESHKLRGFARLVGIEEFVCNPRCSESMIHIVGKLWENRGDVELHLRRRVPELRDLAKLNIELLKDVVAGRITST